MFMGVQQEQVANKRRRPPSHDEHDEADHRRQQAGADADDHHNLNLEEEEEEEEKPRRLPVPWMTGEMATLTPVLPRELTEYTTEDAARFDEDMARTDKMLDELAGPCRVASFHRPVTTCREPVVPYMTPGLLYDKEEEEEEEEEVVVGDLGLRVSKADIKMLRSFAARSGYYPVSERFLCNRRLITQAGADEIRKSDRLMSKLYAWTQEVTREVLRHYDDSAAAAANKDSPDGGNRSINPCTRSAEH